VEQAAFKQLIQTLYSDESRQILATLIRLLGSFELAEEALQDAFSVAMRQWPNDGVPGNPRAWLISTGRYKAIDKLRREQRMQPLEQQLLDDLESPEPEQLDHIEDDSLRLIFTCCHPALTSEARVALTLREVCGLTTEQVASAFLTKPATLAQRIVRAKRKIKDMQLPYEVPQADALSYRVNAVLQVIYLVFNAGYLSATGDTLQHPELMREAIRLARLLRGLLDAPEVCGLLALMLFQASRQRARQSVDGELLRLHEQNRALWNHAMIEEADQLVCDALKRGCLRSYTLQAAIAGIHATAGSAEETDWQEILGLYNVLLRAEYTPVVRLNRAVAVGHVHGAQAALTEIEQLLAERGLADYHLLHATHAHFLNLAGHTKAAITAYQQALQCTELEQERAFLRTCISALLARQ